MRNVKAHYIHVNETAGVPSRFIILDTEALRNKDKEGETQSWSLGVACFIEWPRHGTVRQSTSRFSTPKELWSAVSQFTRRGKRTVLGRYKAGWTGVLVEMEPRQSNTEPMRLCLSIPVQTGVSGDYAGNGKATSIGM